jgi:zinc protease
MMKTLSTSRAGLGCIASRAGLGCIAALAVAAMTLPARAIAADAGIPGHPDQLVFQPLEYDPPRGADHRVKLKNGIPAYLVTDRSLPLVTVSVLMRIGQDLDPAGKEGLADMTMNLLTRSGTKTRNAQQLEDRVAFLGAQLTSSVGGGGVSPFFGGGIALSPAESYVTINFLSKDLDEGLALLVECLKSPAWEAERLKLRRDQMLQAMKERNDDSGNIESREWSFLLRGENHWTNRHTTQASVEGITAADLAAFHRRYVGPKNFILAVSGDVDRGAVVKKLERAFAQWPSQGERPAPPAAPTAAGAPGWYMVDKDVNQGRVSIGLPSIDRYDPDYQAARVMNDILGAGGFSSRLVNRIRSDEGLAYSVRSSFEGGTYYGDPWRIAFQSKVRSVPYAIKIAMTEVNRIRDSLVTPQELELTKNKFVESLPAQFETAPAIANVLAIEELTGRYQKDPNYFAEVRDRVRAVSAADVQRVARRLLEPSRMTVLMVGNAKDIALGDPKHDVQITALAGGEPKRLPLRDPMTMKAMPNP